MTDLHRRPEEKIALKSEASPAMAAHSNEHAEDHPPLRQGRLKNYNKFVVACTLLASLNSILLGYDIGVMSGALLYIKDEFRLNSVQQEVLVGILNLVSLVGGLMAGRLADAVGRRRTMATAAAIFFAGAILMALAPSFAVLMVGRVVSGIGVGFAMIIAPVYTAELSPPGSRGGLVSFAEVFINTGILIGYIANFALSPLPHNIGWRVMLGLGAVPAMFLAAAVLVMPESPRWLAMKNRVADAKAVLIRTSAGDKDEAEAKLAVILESLGRKQDEAYSRQDAEDPGRPSQDKPDPSRPSEEYPSGSNSKSKGVWRQLLWPGGPVRRMLLVSLGIHFLQQASGVDALVYYSPTVFNEAGIRKRTSLLGMTIAVGLTKTLFILVATVNLDSWGRRPLLLSSAAGMAISHVIVATTFRYLHVGAHGNTTGHSGHVSTAAVAIAMLAICSYMASFSIGFGPTVYVLTSEIFPLELRARAMSLSIGVNRAISGTVALTFLSISKALTTSGAFYLFASICAVSFAFVYFLVPETKGKSLEEVCRYFGWEPEPNNSSHSGHEEELKTISTK